MSSTAGPRILFLVGWFGRWPEWFRLYLESCRANPSVDWLVFTDCPVPSDPPANVRFRQTTFPEFCRSVSDRLGVEFPDSDPYKFCDLRPMLGFLFRKELKGYDFWGFSDFEACPGQTKP